MSIEFKVDAILPPQQETNFEEWKFAFYEKNGKNYLYGANNPNRCNLLAYITYEKMLALPKKVVKFKGYSRYSNKKKRVRTCKSNEEFLHYLKTRSLSYRHTDET